MHPSWPVLLTKNGPRRVIPCTGNSPQWVLDLAHSRFENMLRRTRSRSLASFASPDEAVQLQLFRMKTSGGTSFLMVQVVFRAKHKYEELLARQYQAPTELPLTLPFWNKVYHVSGHSQDHGLLQVHASKLSLSQRLQARHSKNMHTCRSPRFKTGRRRPCSQKRRPSNKQQK